MPSWRPVIYAQAAGPITPVSTVVHQLTYRGESISVVRSGIGAPLTGDAVLALGCTPCRTLLFAGSVGGLLGSQAVGDLLLPQRSLCGDGFSRYLGGDPAAHDCFLTPAEPDPRLARSLREVAQRLCREAGLPLHEGAVFSTDTIVAQFAHLDNLVAQHGCIGIEMETAAVFRAARLLGIRAAALLQLSDVIPVCKSVFSGRTEEEMARRRRIRQETLAKIVLETLVGPCEASTRGGP
jgi:purine-nucleoside phosphorylase